MSQYAAEIKKGLYEYGEEIQRFVLDMVNECENNIRDGLMVELSKQVDESSAFNFLKGQGYNVSYDEFERYYEDAQKYMNDNEDLLNRLMEEETTMELSDDDLENVAGGRWTWKKTVAAVGIGLVVGGLVAVTVFCPPVAAATGPAIFGITTAGWGASAVAGAAVAGSAAVGAGAAAGIGAVAGVVAGAATAGVIAAFDPDITPSSEPSGGGRKVY